jgi:hypothetical protein
MVQMPFNLVKLCRKLSSGNFPQLDWSHKHGEILHSAAHVSREIRRGAADGQGQGHYGPRYKIPSVCITGRLPNSHRDKLLAPSNTNISSLPPVSTHTWHNHVKAVRTSCHMFPSFRRAFQALSEWSALSVVSANRLAKDVTPRMRLGCRKSAPSVRVGTSGGLSTDGLSQIPARVSS